MRLTAKELKRASSDGIVIVSRPNRSEGGYNVMAVCIHSMRIRGWPRHVESKSDIAGAATWQCCTQYWNAYTSQYYWYCTWN